VSALDLLSGRLKVSHSFIIIILHHLGHT
jgi:hypothetical protein